MAEHDIKSYVKTMNAINPISNSAGVNGTSIDTKGFESVMFTLIIGAIASGTITASIEHADDNGSGSPGAFTAIDANDRIGSNPSLSAANSNASVGYRGKKQWVRLVTAGTYTTCVNGAICVLGHPKTIPTV
jgi:hypothetical protein